MSVLTVVTRRTGAAPLARLGYRIARALEEELVVLCLEGGAKGGEPLSFAPAEAPADASPIVADVCRGLGELAVRPPASADTASADADSDEPPPAAAEPRVEVRWLVTPQRLPAVLEQEDAVKASVLLAAESERRRDSLGRKLFTAAACHTVLVRLGESVAGPCARILVPTAGGPHATVALDLGERLARAEGGELVPLYVEPDTAELAEEVGARILDRIVAQAGFAGRPHVRPRVELAGDRFQAITAVAGEGFDLLLIGDSNVGSVRRALFGTVPESLLSGADAMRVGIVRSQWTMWQRIGRRIGRWLDLTIPQMRRTERVALFEKLQSGSEWNFDFMTLIGLSTAIATLGLLQSSAAVVIGAMLVAPLMTPILGAGLALVQGNLPLLRTAARAIVSGYLMALLIGLALGLLFPIPELTPELLARGGPTLLDMGVGFFSGLAAAYCLGRPGLLAALPGVAIAAALVPPIATTGVSLALGEPQNARGAALLFGTNVVAIILGAAASLYGGGIRGKRGAAPSRRWVRWGFAVLVLGSAALAVPLGSGLLSQVTYGPREARVADVLRERLEERLAEHPGARLATVADRRDDDGRVVAIEVAAPAPLPQQTIDDLVGIVRDELGAERRVRVATDLEVQVDD